MGRIINAITCSIAVFLFTISTASAQEASPGPRFIRGDVNGDGTVDLSDAVSGLDYLFRNTGSLGCEDAADANDDGEIDISDPIRIMLFLFQGGAANQIPAPSQACGVDGSSDRLTCERYQPCETGPTPTRIVVEDEIGDNLEHVATNPWMTFPNIHTGGITGNVLLTTTAVTAPSDGVLDEVDIVGLFAYAHDDLPVPADEITKVAFNVFVWTPEHTFQEFPGEPAAHYFFWNPTNPDYLTPHGTAARDLPGEDGAVFNRYRMRFKISEADINYSEVVTEPAVPMKEGGVYFIGVTVEQGFDLRIMASNGGGGSPREDWWFRRLWWEETGPATLSEATYQQIASKVTMRKQ